MVDRVELAESESRVCEEVRASLGVFVGRETIDVELATEVAARTTELHNDSLFRARNKQYPRSRFIQSAENDDRLTYVKWQEDESHDEVIAEDVESVSSIDCRPILKAGRAMLKNSALMCMPRNLVIFQGYSNRVLGLHLDRDNEPDFVPDPNFRREFLNLRGVRRIRVVESPVDEIHELRLNPGDSYSFRPNFTYHGVELARDNLALYIQGY